MRKLAVHRKWVDGLGDTGAWLEGLAAAKIADFAGEAEAADAGVMQNYAEAKRITLIACLVHKARMRVRDDLTTMFTKRVAIKSKRARTELEEIRGQQQAIVEGLVANYRTLLRQVDTDGPAQTARAKAGALTKETLDALEGLDEESGGLGGEPAPQASGRGAVPQAGRGADGAVQRPVHRYVGGGRLRRVRRPVRADREAQGPSGLRPPRDPDAIELDEDGAEE